MGARCVTLLRWLAVEAFVSAKGRPLVRVRLPVSIWLPAFAYVWVLVSAGLVSWPVPLGLATPQLLVRTLPVTVSGLVAAAS